jgi:O-antigen ligase
MSQSAAFFSKPSMEDCLRAALLAFFFGLPITNGSWSLIGYFHGFVLLFTITSLITLRKKLPPLLGQMQRRYRFAYYLLLSWCVLVSLSLANVLLKDITAFHIFAASQRYLHDAITLLFCFALARLLLLGSINLKAIATALCLGMFLMMVVHAYTYQLDVISAHQWFRNPPLAPHMRDLGNLACVSIVACFVLLNGPSLKPLERQFYLICFMANWGFLIWTGGRMGIAASITSCIVLAAFYLFQGKALLKRAIASLSTLIIAALIGSFAGNQLSVFDWNGIGRTASFTEQVKDIQQSTTAVTATTESTEAAQDASQSSFSKANQLTTGRAEMWKLSINAMLESPWLGLGPFGYFFIPERFYDDQPHNFIVQFLVEWGFLGSLPILLLLLLCAFYILKKLPAKIRQHDNNFAIGSAIVLVLTLHGLTGGTYFKIQPLFCLATGFAAIIAAALKPREEKQL